MSDNTTARLSAHADQVCASLRDTYDKVEISSAELFHLVMFARIGCAAAAAARCQQPHLAADMRDVLGEADAVLRQLAKGDAVLEMQIIGTTFVMLQGRMSELLDAAEGKLRGEKRDGSHGAGSVTGGGE